MPMRPPFAVVNVTTTRALRGCHALTEPPSAGGLLSVTVDDGGRMGATTRRQRTWIWTPSQGKHQRQSSLSDKGGNRLVRYERGELPSVKAAAREAGMVKATFDRTKRLLEKHASSFTASEKAELREILGKAEARPEAT